MALPTQTLIDALQLRAQLEGPTPPVVVEASFDLADTQAGERHWHAGHLPGSVYLHLDRDLSGVKSGRNGRHPLPERSAFAATLGRIGVTPLTSVVLLDRQDGPYAARVWWMLRWMGHVDAAVLDGGLQAWIAVGGSLSTQPRPPAAVAPYPERTARARTVSSAEVMQGLGHHRLLDARAGERFRGEVEPLDTAAGHIPGARNRFFKDNLSVDGRFKPASTLREEYCALLGQQPPSAMVHQCGSGVTACHNLLAMEHAGLAGSVLYPGSWSEWSCDASRPIARG